MPPDTPQQPLALALPDGTSASALLDAPPRPRAAFVLAHGAGAGMHHPFLAAIAAGLVARQVAVLRYQFPFMEQGRRRTDPPAVAQACVRAAVAEAAGRLPRVPLFAGGKSFGGRMTSQAQAAQPLPDVLGLAFLGFPLHPAGRPSTDRAAHLRQLRLPLLFLQGTRDTLAELELIRGVAHSLGPTASLHVVEGADHGFDVLVRSGRTREEVLQELLDTLVAWMRALS
jgi:predicted alpha/beta-hydrolase family hydrolase